MCNVRRKLIGDSAAGIMLSINSVFYYICNRGWLMKAYLVLDFSIIDIDNFMVYVRDIKQYIEKHKGKYIVEGVKPEVIEGDWAPDTLVILEFPSSENAKEFLNDSNIQPLFDSRKKTTKSKLILVNGGAWHDNSS